MRRRDFITFILLLMCLLLLSSCGKENVTGEVVKNDSKPFAVQYPKVEYKVYKQGDFSVKFPDWEKTDYEGDERQLTVKKGICSVTVNKHNAIVDDMFDFLKSKVIDTGYNLTIDGKDSKGRYINYEMYKDSKAILSQMRLKYCNYQTYTVTMMCWKEQYTDYYETIADTVLGSLSCAKEHNSIPTNNKVNGSIVNTKAGEKYGIDTKAVVYQINHNPYLTKVLSRFNTMNLSFEKQEYGVEILLKVTLQNGKVALVEEGHFADADVTIIMHLMEAINTFSNVHNIDSSNLALFLKNAQTEPESVKEQVLT